MLTENDARALLAQAAETIEVGPSTPVEPVRRRAWPVLAAAVATLVAGVGVWAGIAATDDTDAAPDPSVDPAEVEPGTVPSVFGHRREGATRILTDAGLEVRVVERPACDPPGQAIGTLPNTGVRMEPGSVVTLQVAAEGLTLDCYSELTVPWQLLGLATGEVAAPELLTGSLTTYFDGERRTVPDGTDVKAWGSPSALEALRAAVEWSPEVPRTWQVLETAAPGCDGEPSPSFALQLAGVRAPVVTRYAIEYDDPDAPCVQLTVAGAFDRPVRGVAVETAGLEVGDPEPAPERGPIVPAVFGLTEGEALKALQDAGVGNLVTVAEPGCLEPGRALGTEPGPGATSNPSDPVRLTVTYDDPGANCALVDRAFWSLLDAARDSGPGPRSADTVRTWLDGVETTVTGAEEPAGWADVPALSALASVANDQDLPRDGVEMRLDTVGRTEPLSSFPAQCDVGGGPPPELPAAATDRPSFQAWFAYQSGGATRACLVVDVFNDEQLRVDGLAVRTVDPEGLLPEIPTAPVSTAVDDLVSELTAFARGEWGVPPLADQVGLYREGDYVRTEPASALGNEKVWFVCDPTMSDSCVGSALAVLRYADGDVPVAPAEPRRVVPPGTASAVVLGPTEVTSCQPRGTVTLFLDTEDAIVGVDVAADTSQRRCGEEGLAPPE